MPHQKPRQLLQPRGRERGNEQACAAPIRHVGARPAAHDAASPTAIPDCPSGKQKGGAPKHHGAPHHSPYTSRPAAPEQPRPSEVRARCCTWRPTHAGGGAWAWPAANAPPTAHPQRAGEHARRSPAAPRAAPDVAPITHRKGHSVRVASRQGDEKAMSSRPQHPWTTVHARDGARG